MKRRKKDGTLPSYTKRRNKLAQSEKRKETAKKWRREHRDELRKWARKHYQKNKKHYLQYKRKWRAKRKKMGLPYS
ncbi:MAG: hypothetical protein A2W23_09540 [Planctomycetes bacterium RBG_16_43_13]|nr:MAG: hypothetical protein A2W23_09540 [Planctomycetes bacterium RBG_16_43_13]